MEQNIESLITQAEEFMSASGYSRLTIAHYRASWNKAAALCAQWGASSSYGPDVEERVLSELGAGDYGSLKKSEKAGIWAVRCLLSIELEGRMPEVAGHALTYVVPERFLAVVADYRGELIARGAKESTVAGNLVHVRALLSQAEAPAIGELAVRDVERFASSFAGSSPQTHAGRLYAVRAFLRFAVGRYGCDPALAAMFPVIPGHKHHRVASAFTAEEVSASLEAARPPAASLRDAAMLTVVAQTGMRAGDVRALRLGDVDWAKGQLAFVQSKTGIPLRLPMTDEVRYSLMDYLANERPAIDDDRLFVSSRAPLRSFAGTRNPFHYVAASAYERAGVDIGDRHHGMHSLRHSLAARTLAAKTPLPVITGVLGHSDSNTAGRYLEIDVERLRDLALEVPNG